MEGGRGRETLRKKQLPLKRTVFNGKSKLLK